MRCTLLVNLENPRVRQLEMLAARCWRHDERAAARRIRFTGPPSRRAGIQTQMKLTFLIVFVGCYIPTLAFGDGPPFSCPKPMAIPDAWTDLNQNGQYDAGEPYDPLVTGTAPARNNPFGRRN